MAAHLLRSRAASFAKTISSGGQRQVGTIPMQSIRAATLSTRRNVQLRDRREPLKTQRHELRPTPKMNSRTWLRVTRLLALLCSTGLLTTIAKASADLATGKRAYEQGDYDTALKCLRPLADTGNPDAQDLIGEM